MSALELLNSKDNASAMSFGQRPTSFTETVGAAFENRIKVENADARAELITMPINDRDDEYRRRFGVSYPAHVEGRLPRFAKPQISQEEIDDEILRGRESDPEKYKGLKTTQEIIADGEQQARDARSEFEDISSRNPSPSSRLAGTLTGDISGAMTDTINLMTLPLGAGPVRAVGQGGAATAKLYISKAAQEGAIQAGVEGLSIPAVSDWYNQLGYKYGLKEAAQQVGGGFLAGAVFRGAVDAAVPTVRATAKGARNVSSYALDKIASTAPKLSQSTRDALQYLSRRSYIEDAPPVPHRSRADEVEHVETFNKTAESVEAYNKPSVELEGVSRIVTPDNQLEIEVRSRVVELSDLVTSNQKGFDPELQPRDRAGRAASDARISEIAARLDPAQLTDSRLSSTGSPVVGPDFLVESGNGRTLALREAYAQRPERAAQYRQHLKEQGYNVDGYEQPVLIRQRTSELTPEQRRNFVTKSNEDAVDRLSVTERAVADSKLISDDIVNLFEGGEITAASNRGFVNAFSERAVSPSERNAFIGPDGTLSQDGVKRVRGAILAKAYDDANIVQKLLEDTDTSIKTIGNVLMDNAGQWAQLRARVRSGIAPQDLDITEALTDAIKTINHARQRNQKIGDIVSQQGLFPDSELKAETEALLRGMYNENMTRPLGRNKLNDYLGFYIEEAGKVDAGPNLLGLEPTSALDILQTSLQRLHGNDIFSKLKVDDSLQEEIAALRQAGALDLASNTKFAGTGKTYIEALTEARGRPETVKTIDMKSPERKKIHKAIAKDLVAEPKGGFAREKTIELVIGPPGAGKSAVIAANVKKARRAIEIDSDEVKKRLPEFDGGLGANAVHEESKMITATIFDYAVKKGLNIVHPIVGAKPSRVVALIDDMKAKGYSVNVRLVDIPANESMRRVIARYESSGRVIPSTYINSIGHGPRDTFDAVKIRSDVNAYSYHDNSVAKGAKPRIIESNDPAFPISRHGDGERARRGPDEAPRGLAKRTADGIKRLEEGDGELFDVDAHRLAEYRNPNEISEILETYKEADDIARLESEFDRIVNAAPDEMIELEDGLRMTFAEYKARLDGDKNLLDAITTCRVA